MIAREMGLRRSGARGRERGLVPAVAPPDAFAAGGLAVPGTDGAGMLDGDAIHDGDTILAGGQASPAGGRAPLSLAAGARAAASRARAAASRAYRRGREIALTRVLVTDALLAVLVGVVSTPWLLTTRPGPAEWLLQAALIVPLAWRRRFPCSVFAAVCAVALVQWILGFRLVADLALLVALATVATFRSRWTALAATAVLEIGAVLASVRWSLTGSWLSSLVFLSGMIAAALLLGVMLRARSALVASLTERAGRLERERDQQALISAAAERARIAREMHDVIGHQLAVIVSLADGASAKLTSDPARAAAAIASVSDVGRQALGETRGLLGVLRADGSDDGLAPQPGLAALSGLVAQTRATGLAASLDCAGDPATLGADIQLAVYRIAQEAITNTLRHAAGAESVAIRVTIGPDSVELEVVDDGRQMTAAVAVPGGGQGLAGMRERARACGGSVIAGPAAGGWVVRAILPTEWPA